MKKRTCFFRIGESEERARAHEKTGLRIREPRIQKKKKKGYKNQQNIYMEIQTLGTGKEMRVTQERDKECMVRKKKCGLPSLLGGS